MSDIHHCRDFYPSRTAWTRVNPGQTAHSTYQTRLPVAQIKTSLLQTLLSFTEEARELSQGVDVMGEMFPIVTVNLLRPSGFMNPPGETITSLEIGTYRMEQGKDWRRFDLRSLFEANPSGMGDLRIGTPTRHYVEAKFDLWMEPMVRAETKK